MKEAFTRRVKWTKLWLLLDVPLMELFWFRLWCLIFIIVSKKVILGFGRLYLYGPLIFSWSLNLIWCLLSFFHFFATSRFIKDMKGKCWVSVSGACRNEWCLWICLRYFLFILWIVWISCIFSFCLLWIYLRLLPSSLSLFL